jgi:hypothetical protein
LSVPFPPTVQFQSKPVFNCQPERGRRTRERWFFWERALRVLRRWFFGDTGFLLKRKNMRTKKKIEKKEKKMFADGFFETVSNL